MDAEELEDYSVDLDNISTNSSIDSSNYDSESDLEDQIRTILLFSVILINLAANALAIFAVRRFKKQQFHTHNLIFHLSLLDAMNLVMLVVEHALIELEVHWLLYVITNFQHTFLFASFLVNTLLGIDWALESYHPSWSVRFRKDGHFQLWCVYISIFLLVGAFTFLSHVVIVVWMSLLISMVGYTALLLSTIIILCVYWWKRRTNTSTSSRMNLLGLKISATAALMWCPCFVNILTWMLIHPIFRYHVFVIIATIALWKPVVNVYILYSNDREYRACFLQVFRCSFSGYSVQGLDGNSLRESTVAYESHGV